MQLVECVPNFSEGRRPEVIAAIRDAAAAVPGVTVLDLHADPTHNRMVLTFVGSPEAVTKAAVRCAEQAARLIDMTPAVRRAPAHRRHRRHPVRADLRRHDGDLRRAGERGRAADRRGAWHPGLPLRPRRPPAGAGAPAGRAPRPVRGASRRRSRPIPDRAPDFGPARLGTAGATAVGARPFLVAYNVNLATSDLALAKRIARAIRESSGGLPAVQALGMLDRQPRRRPGLDEPAGHRRDAAPRRLRDGRRPRRRRQASRSPRVRSSGCCRSTPSSPPPARTSRRGTLGRRRSSRHACCKR